jgi:hypothetical protein
LASYKPYQSTGEDFLQNYLGMIGIPIEMYPEFPAKEKIILLTEQAAFDKELVAKIRKHLEAGGNIVITSGLLKVLQGKGIEQIAEIANTGNVLNVHEFWGGSGSGEGANLGETPNLLVPEISFMTNDAWPVVRGTASGRGAPLLLQDHYSKGNFYVLTIPENANDLYVLPQQVLTSIRNYLLRGQPYEIDAPALVSLFSYDNHAFAVESFRDQPAQVTILASAETKQLRDLSTGELIQSRTSPPQPSDPRAHFTITVQPHSFIAFEEVK